MTDPRFEKPIPALPLPTREYLVRVAHALFPADRVAPVLSVLDGYESPPFSQDGLRVKMAVLVLSEGSFEKLEEFAAEAMRDYRNVLYWYEYTKPGVELRFALERRLAELGRAAEGEA